MAVLDSEAFQRKSFGPTPVARQSGKSMTENPPRVAQTGATCTSYKLLILLAPQVGLEPTTLRLTVGDEEPELSDLLGLS